MNNLPLSQLIWVQGLSSGMIRMLRTIQIGSCMSVQGLLVRHLDDGRIVIRVGETLYQGIPVPRAD